MPHLCVHAAKHNRRRAQMTKPSSDVAFSDSVKAVQTLRGSRAHFENIEARGGWATELNAEITRFIGQVTTAYLATASADGQPYVQHRGGPAGFLRVIDRTTLGFVDFKGNRQYVTTGNLAENPRAHLFLMDYQGQQRVKLWGRARMIEGDDALTQRLFPDGYHARIEHVVMFNIAALDINCSQHIPQMFHAGDVAQTIQQIQARMREMDAEITSLKSQLVAATAASKTQHGV
jgi:uncharacterized protein